MSLSLFFLLLACADLPTPPAVGANAEDPAVGPTDAQDDVDAVPVEMDLGLALSVPTEMPTVIRALWRGPPTGEIFYDDGETLRRAEPTATEEGFTAWLLGARPGSDVAVWVEGIDDGVTYISEQVSTTTSALAEQLVELEGREMVEGATTGDLVLVSYIGDAGGGAALYNGAGEPVWAWQADKGYRVTGANWCGAGPCVLLERGQDQFEENLILQLGPLGETLRTIEAPHAHHDLAMSDDGAIVWLQAAPEDTDEYGLVYGDRLIQTASDGSERVLWDSWDTLPLVEGTQWEGRYYNDGRDWTHANGIDERDGDWLVSLGGQAAILEIDGETGEILRTLEGQDPDLGDARFKMQHSPSWTPDGNLLLFVNEGPGGDSSWVAEFEVDGDSLHEVWHTDRFGALATSALGHTWRRDDGRTVVDFGKVPVVQQLDEDGEPQWELEFDEGTWTTQVRPVEAFTVR